MHRFTFAFFIGLSSLAVAVPTYASQFKSVKSSSQIQIEQCWIRLLPAHLPSAGYFALQNNGEKVIELKAATTPSYQQVMLHQTNEVDGMTKMQMAKKIEIPAKGTLTFEPGGFHIMFEKPTSTLKVGETMQLKLLFSDGQTVTTNCKVNPAKALSFD